MEMTLSPNIEREAIQEIHDRRRDESAPPFLLECVKVTAKLLVHGTLHRLLTAIADTIIRHVESRNDRIANHLRWFPRATADLKAKVEETGVPASEELRVALDGLITQISDSTARLLQLVELLDANSELGRAVHRSMRLLLEVKASAIEMKRVGRLAHAPVDAITLRIEAAHASMISAHGRILTETAVRDTHLLALAQQASARRSARAGHLTEAQRVLEEA